MFKYNYRIIHPLVVLFIVCLLFIFINQKDLSYNPEIINQDFSENINSCNKRKKKLNTISSRKNNNNKILDYVFENFTSRPVVIPDNNSSDTSTTLSSTRSLEAVLPTASTAPSSPTRCVNA